MKQRGEYWKRGRRREDSEGGEKKVCSVIGLDLHVTFQLKLMPSTQTWLRQCRQGVEQLAARSLNRYLNRNQTT